jgi:hypothetical protein
LSGINERFDLVIGVSLNKSLVLLIEVDKSIRSDGIFESRSMAGSKKEEGKKEDNRACFHFF